MSGLMGTGASSSGQDAKASAGERSRFKYFYLVENIRSFTRYFLLGIPLVLPLVVAVFSINFAIGIAAIEILSYIFGKLAQDFDYWWNTERYSETQMWLEKKELEAFPTTKSSEVREILDRLSHFENKYYIRISDMYRYLNEDRIPFENNLDWIEIVSLLNRLSLNVGKHFEEEKNEKGKEL